MSTMPRRAVTIENSSPNGCGAAPVAFFMDFVGFAVDDYFHFSVTFVMVTCVGSLLALMIWQSRQLNSSCGGVGSTLWIKFKNSW